MAANKQLQTTISSERLILRLLTVADLDAVIKYWTQNKEHLEPSGPEWPTDFLSKDFWLKQIARNSQELQNDQSYRAFLFTKACPEDIVGHVSFSAILRSVAQFCYLGYGLAEHAQGKGYMTEILPAAIAFAFNDLSLHRIMANYTPANERSGKLLQRLGFEIEGQAKNYLYLNGRWQDHILSSLTNPNWLPEKLETKSS